MSDYSKDLFFLNQNPLAHIKKTLVYLKIPIGHLKKILYLFMYFFFTTINCLKKKS